MSFSGISVLVRRSRFMIAGLIASVLGTPGFVRADVPQSMCIQGYLENAQGLPIDGSVEFCLSIWDSAVGGVQMWPAVGCHSQVLLVDDGVFALAFGDAILTAQVFGTASPGGSQARWIEIATGPGGMDVMSPRIELRTTPYAFRAAYADNVVGGGGTFGSCTPPVSGEIHMFNGATPLSACVETITLDASAGATAGGQIGIRRGNDMPGVSLQAESEEGAEIHLNSLDGDQTVTIHGGNLAGGGRIAMNNGQIPNRETIILDAAFGPAADGSAFILSGSAGDERVRIQTLGDGGSLNLNSIVASGPTFTAVANDPDGAGRLYLRKGAQTEDTTVRLSGLSGGGGAIFISNGQSPNLETITLEGHGLANAGEITLRNELGNRGLYLRGDIGPTTPGFGGQIGLNKRSGQLSVLLEGGASGAVALYNNNGVNNLLLQGDHGGYGDQGGDGGSIIRMFTGSSPDGSTPDRETVTLDAKADGGGGVISLQNGLSPNRETVKLDAYGSLSGGFGGLLTLADSAGRTAIIQGLSNDGAPEIHLIDPLSSGVQTIELDARRAGGGGWIELFNGQSPNQRTITLNGGTGNICISGTLSQNNPGGCDLAEIFEHSDDIVAQPGMVMAIDPENPGRLTVSTQAYEMRVAGIISGAGDLKPGIKLGQRADGSDDLPVALSGRVYCYVDATEHALEIGDMLTTSSTPGFAMKAVDRERAFGAVLGKAMEPMPKGKKGLVLVLVSLQ